MAYTRSLALGYFAKMSVRTQLAPAWQVGQVGERTRTRRGVPTSSLNRVWNSPTECRSVKCMPGGAVGWKRGDSTISQADSRMIASASRLGTFTPPGKREKKRAGVFIAYSFCQERRDKHWFRSSTLV